MRQVMVMSEEQAFELFKELRWGKEEKIACPICGVVDKHYFLRTRRQWRCKHCNHTFSVTSGTIFAFHKLELKIYLAAISIFTNAVKGVSALQLARDLGVQYKTAFVLVHKIRESLIVQRDDTPLVGEIHLDGAYVNGHIRPQNKKKDRIDRRLAKHQKPDKRCVFVMREKNPSDEHNAEHQQLIGGRKTLTFVLRSENQEDVTMLAEKYITETATVCADENHAYDPLHAKFDIRRVNHSEEYRSDDGTTNNMAESFFARFRRMQYGQMHKFGTLYLDNYANEAAYREDTRRWSNGSIFADIVMKCAHTKTSQDWCGYWQGNKRPQERLAA